MEKIIKTRSEIYKRLCRRYIKGNPTILHLGAGFDSLKISKLYKGAVRFISLDIDLSELVRNNNKLKIVGDANNLPFKSEIFDFILSESFFEHIAVPKSVFFECYRVAKKKSYLIFSIPNRFYYISLFNLYAPKIIKKIAIKARKSNRRYFPAYYRCNTYKDIKTISTISGYKLISFHIYIDHTHYFDFFSILRIFFLIIDKIIKNINFLARKFYSGSIGILQKP